MLRTCPLTDIRRVGRSSTAAGRQSQPDGHRADLPVFPGGLPGIFPYGQNGVVPSAAAARETAGPARFLTYLGGFFAAGTAVSALYATTGVGFWCPLRLVTGWSCPFCGATRMGAALLRGDVALAWAYNPLVFVGLVLLGLLGGLALTRRLRGLTPTFPPALAARLRAVHPTGWVAVGLAIGVGYTLARNLL